MSHDLAFVVGLIIVGFLIPAIVSTFPVVARWGFDDPSWWGSAAWEVIEKPDRYIMG